MKRGPKNKTHCSRGHEFTEENTIQCYSNNGTLNGRRCRICHNERVKLDSREDKNGTCYRSRTSYQLRTRYGIKGGLEERDAILAAQDGKCAICGTSDCVWDKGFTKVWHIDHKHDGTINHRGIICSDCNHTIGRVKDNPALLRKMADYIESYQEAQ